MVGGLFCNGCMVIYPGCIRYDVTHGRCTHTVSGIEHGFLTWTHYGGKRSGLLGVVVCSAVVQQQQREHDKTSHSDSVKTRLGNRGTRPTNPGWCGSRTFSLVGAYTASQNTILGSWTNR